MASVDIDGNTYLVYADVDTADEYLAAAIHADSWRALSGSSGDDTKARALVTATRTLDRQNWKGDKPETSPAQELAWPRIDTGIPDVVDDVVPQAIIDASIELALALVGGSDVQDVQSTAQTLQSIRAGSVALTYFRGAEGDPQRFPQIVQELLAGYLEDSGDTGIGAGVSTGVDGCSVTHEDYNLTEGL